jgi:hypothetical protein
MLTCGWCLSLCGEIVGGVLKRVVTFPALQNPTPGDRIRQIINHLDPLTHGENIQVVGWRRRMSVIQCCRVTCEFSTHSSALMLH